MNETTQWPCPECKTMIPGTSMQHRLGYDDTHPARQRVTCPTCDTPLFRFPEGRAGIDKGWRVDRSPIEQELAE